MSNTNPENTSFMDGEIVDDRVGRHVFDPEEFMVEEWPSGDARYKLKGRLLSCNGAPASITFNDIPSEEIWNATFGKRKSSMQLNRNLIRDLKEFYGVTIDDMIKSGAPKSVKIGVNVYIQGKTEERDGFAEVDEIRKLSDEDKKVADTGF